MDIKEFSAALRELEDEYYRERRILMKELDEWIGSQWPLYKSGKFEADIMWQWGCQKSPIDICIYNDEEDPVHDCCVFCGLPEERK